ncbi:hypothetical protein DSO57_1002336 [Entomophthora muscae]|uniref:Uncharacterized protein n=1 Tax=Entomophthora muscae TaxID=34485 RepID=A0ACC2UI88_9FUNG|nr:hypothetical protein DSO57_1002336 [Entomophthora muscae]
MNPGNDGKDDQVRFEFHEVLPKSPSRSIRSRASRNLEPVKNGETPVNNNETQPLLTIPVPSYTAEDPTYLEFKNVEEGQESDGFTPRAKSVDPDLRQKRNTWASPGFKPPSVDGIPPYSGSRRYSKSQKGSAAPSLRLPSQWISRTNRGYDQNKKDLVQENNGIRVWYDDYTTIDWIHDYVKERVRLRRIRSIPGFRGWLINTFDASQAWILVTLIGVCCGCIAAGIDVGTEFLSDLKSGYCTSNFFYNRSFCCWGKEESRGCPEWQRWSKVFNMASPYSVEWFDFAAYFSFAVLFALCAALLVYYTAEPFPSSKKRKKDVFKYYAAGSGIPEVKTILGGFVMRGFLGLQTLWVKSVGLTLVVSSGMSLGKEGPLVHIACCMGNVLCRIFEKYNYNEGKRREILSASSAAGVAVAFGAPIGGVLFSLEEVSYYFPSKTMWRSFLCALIAAMTLKIINPFRTGKIVLFQVTFDQQWHTFELLTFLIIGVFGGVYGAMFCKLNVMWAKLRRRSWMGRRPVLEVLMVVSLSASLNYFNKFTRMSATELIAELFEECTGLSNRGDGLCVSQLANYSTFVWSLSLTILEKFLLTVITFGIKTPAGIFVPSMAVGACFGRILGLFAQHWQQMYPAHWIFESCGQPGVNCFTPGVYAMVGATAALAGVTRMTVSLVVIMFELTGSLTYALPIMLSVMVSKWVGDALEKPSIYDNLIELNNYPFLDNKREYIHTQGLTHILERDLDVIRTEEENTVGRLNSKLNALAESGYPDGGFPILDGTHLVGYIASNDLEHALEIATIPDDTALCHFRTGAPEDTPNNMAPYMDLAPLSISINASMEVVLELFIKLGVRYLCVTENSQFVGVIHKKRLLGYLHDLGDS